MYTFHQKPITSASRMMSTEIALPGPDITFCLTQCWKFLKDIFLKGMRGKKWKNILLFLKWGIYLLAHHITWIAVVINLQNLGIFLKIIISTYYQSQCFSILIYLGPHIDCQYRYLSIVDNWLLSKNFNWYLADILVF